MSDVKPRADQLLLIVDLAAVGVFALEGGLAAARHPARRRARRLAGGRLRDRALLGAAVLVVGGRGLPRPPTMAAGALACFVLRMLAVWQDWNLPTA